MDRFVVVRPYDARIRERVFAHLSQANIKPDSSVEIPPGTTDGEAMKILGQVKNRILLIPFHGHRDESGNFVNGLLFSRRLHREVPELKRAPILMPVSRFAVGAARLLWEMGVAGDPLAADLKERILLVFEEDLDDENLHHRIRKHVDQFQTRQTVFSGE